MKILLSFAISTFLSVILQAPTWEQLLKYPCNLTVSTQYARNSSENRGKGKNSTSNLLQKNSFYTTQLCSAFPPENCNYLSPLLAFLHHSCFLKVKYPNLTCVDHGSGAGGSFSNKLLVNLSRYTACKYLCIYNSSIRSILCL